MQKTGLNICDGYQLRDVLVDVCQEHNIDFCKEEDEINKYMRNLDMYTKLYAAFLKVKRMS